MKIIFLLILCLAVVYLFLICPRIIHKPDRSGFMNFLYAHRGLFDNKSEAPENSLAAFQKAVDAGYGIELDVQLTKDNIPVVFHDATLKRMCKIDGNVWDFTLDELKKFTLGNSRETIPTFKEVLDLVNGSVPIIVEYKLDVPSTKVCEISDYLLQNYNGLYCIESFHPKAVRWYKQNRPDVMRGQLSEELFRSEDYKGNLVYYFVSYLLTNVICRPDFIAYNHEHAHNISRKICSLLGALPICYTIKNQAEYEIAKRHFTLIIFDGFIPE